MRRAKCGTQTCEKRWTVECVVPDARAFDASVARGVRQRNVSDCRG